MSLQTTASHLRFPGRASHPSWTRTFWPCRSESLASRVAEECLYHWPVSQQSVASVSPQLCPCVPQGPLGMCYPSVRPEPTSWCTTSGSNSWPTTRGSSPGSTPLPTALTPATSTRCPTGTQAASWVGALGHCLHHCLQPLSTHCQHPLYGVNTCCLPTVSTHFLHLLSSPVVFYPLFIFSSIVDPLSKPAVCTNCLYSQSVPSISPTICTPSSPLLPSFDPFPPTVALNYQSEGRMMQLNRAKFETNGNCGYVLKPQQMCRGVDGGCADGSVHS